MPRFVPYNRGWIEVITGPMFSGKSEELIRRLIRAKIAGQKIIAYKPSIDNRFSENKIVSRSGAEIECENINLDNDDIDFLFHQKKSELDKDVYAFDEAQFFFPVTLSRVCEHLADLGKRVIVCGLGCDYKNEPFNTMSYIMAKAEFVDKISAICIDCGDMATRTARTTKSTDRVVIGDTETYKAVCRKCHRKYKGD